MPHFHSGVALSGVGDSSKLGAVWGASSRPHWGKCQVEHTKKLFSHHVKWRNPPDSLKACGFYVSGVGTVSVSWRVQFSQKGRKADRGAPARTGGNARPWLTRPCRRRPAEGPLTPARASPLRSVP